MIAPPTLLYSDSPTNSSEAGSPRLVFTTPAGQTTQPVPPIVSSFSDFLSSNQMAAATSPKLPQTKPSNRGKFSLKRTTASIMAFRSAKSKNAATLPILPSPEVDEWGTVVQSPHSAKF